MECSRCKQESGGGWRVTPATKPYSGFLTVRGIHRKGCRPWFPVEHFEKNGSACPSCHRPDPLEPEAYIELLLDPDSFRELYAPLTLEQIAGWQDFYDYTPMRRKAAQHAHGCEALMVGHGTMGHTMRGALALGNFAYMGGSMGAVMGEKVRLIVQFAIAHPLPLLAITTTAGARMQEGTVALYQMAKTTAAVLALRQAGLPFLSVLGPPTVGGAGELCHLGRLHSCGSQSDDCVRWRPRGETHQWRTRSRAGRDDRGILRPSWRHPCGSNTERNEVTDCGYLAHDPLVS